MSSSRKLTALGAGLALLASGLVAASIAPAHATPMVGGLVISEVYGGGGNSGATHTNDFIELYNPTASAASLTGYSVQYKSATGAAWSGKFTLSGSIPAHGYYLVMGQSGGAQGDALPTPDATNTGVNLSATNGNVALASSTATLSCVSSACSTDPAVVDLVGFGTGNTYLGEGAAPAGSNTTSLSRDASNTNTLDNEDDFLALDPAPVNAAGEGDEEEPPADITFVDATIAQIQGTGFSSQYSTQPDTYVTTQGVVTAVYGATGYHSYVIQTEGTGDASDETPGASDGIAVQQASGPIPVAIGDFVEITGPVIEEFGVTKLTWDPSDADTGLVDLSGSPHTDPMALSTDYPTTGGEREAHESELLDVSGQDFTVSETFPTNQYAEIGLATGGRPLITPTEVADAQDAPAIAAVEDANYARGVVLDDGADISYLTNAYENEPLPWLSPTNPVRVGAAADVVGPVVLDYQFGSWRFQPTERVTDEGADVATFVNTRPENLTPQEVGGDLELATFNVLNYFPTTGEEFVANGGSCEFHTDRVGDPVTNDDCGATGPRGAAEVEDLLRQQDKIVRAINTLDADVVGLEEIENSVKFGKDRDFAVATLVEALNADAGAGTWAYAPSPAAENRPAPADEDVIRTAFIYKPAAAALVGESEILIDEVNFDNAREPLAQAFKAAGAPDADAFAVIVNHFKSKSSGVDDGTGQGKANPDRIGQAEALSAFADAFAADRGTEAVFLAGDFNAYSMEDPMQVLYEDGYTAIESDTEGEESYNFDGMDGSLDHILANDVGFAMVTGADVWTINAAESVAFEYSRHNYNATDFYAPDVFRASDHNPEIVGLDVPDVEPEPELAESELKVKATPKKVTEDKTRVKLHIQVKAEGEKPTGQVTIVVQDQGTFSGQLRNGKFDLRLAEFDTAGIKTVEVTYSGDADVAGDTETITIKVSPAKKKNKKS